ncbi:hypothetical protein BOTBODRAFT_486843 [Botryobasidium botryosum FD-172 SS1]|uniref:DUF300-domain-containing protein n=1 Tax=Botryobasidium botryosum (strain FD-172 SS1) TaxID=930990 RepID=A0A067M4Z1_BOTB1|nr:hypothetical protein BOTBODRAFT_486843 [Botryobasidium botryosum FD-172 SS1]
MMAPSTLNAAAGHTALETFGSGSGSSLNDTVLSCAALFTIIATVVSGLGIYLQLKNYRKPRLQRMVVRIMIMVPIYAIASLISLFSLEAAFVIDAIRDIYEAFVIYCFFNLLLAYLGGERSLLILLYGRQPLPHVFPVTIFKREFDPSDPFTFLFLKRGILQYVQVKPILAAITLILKATGTFHEGDLSVTSGYLWISLVYNISICTALYCLANFWRCVSADIKPFRPMPKFLCVKGILFFSFWQAIGISILVAMGFIKKVGPYTDAEHISLALTDTLICFEMPFFAFAHWFAFSHKDYIDPDVQYAARMPFYYACRDAFGYVDVLQDSRETFKGAVSYRTFEPAEGGMHQGLGRDARIRAGLRYAKGGKQKYWLPVPPDDREPDSGPVHAIRHIADERYNAQHGYAPLADEQARHVVHDTDSDSEDSGEGGGRLALEFDAPEEMEDAMYAESRKYLFGDYHYPAIDVSGEAARRKMWEEEERILTDQRAAAFAPGMQGNVNARLLASPPPAGYGAASGRGGVKVLVTDADADEEHQDKKGKGRTGVYGAWAERDNQDGGAWARSREEGGPSPHVTPRSAVVDMSPDHDGGGNHAHLEGGTRLGYARSATKLGVPSVHSARSSRRSTPQVSPAGSKPGTPRGTPRISPPLPSRTPSRPSSAAGSHDARRSPASPQNPHYARPDAVDLVVEDKQATEDDMVRERKKGEPAVRQLEKQIVYRREYIPEDSQHGPGGVVTEVVEEKKGKKKQQQGGGRSGEGPTPPGGAPSHSSRRSDARSANNTRVNVDARVDVQEGGTRVDVTKEEEREAGSDSDSEISTRETKVHIATAATPPVHAQVDFSRPDPFRPGVALDDEPNPWA